MFWNRAKKAAVCVFLLTNILCLVGFDSIAQATTYYVDIDRGDDDWDGLAKSRAGEMNGPWKNLPGTVDAGGEGWTVLMAGDIVCVKGGTRNRAQVIVNSRYYRGEAKYDSIRIRGGQLADPAWGARAPILDGEGVRTFGFWLGEADKEAVVQGVTIEGFDIRNIKGGGIGKGFDPEEGSACIAAGGDGKLHYCAIRRCRLQDALRDGSGQGYGIETSNGDHLIVENNLIGPNIGTAGIEFHRTHWSVIRMNHVRDCGGFGVVVTANRCDVNGNVIEMTPPFVGDFACGLRIAGEGVDVWNNVVYLDRDTSVPLAEGACAQGAGFAGSANCRGFHNTVCRFGNPFQASPFGAGLVVEE
ncbi:MAG: right-handed parallel beta-helix repeat-containing protein, partial [Planctomycetota bacterium]